MPEAVVLRVAMLFTAALLALLAIGAVSPDLAASGQRVGVAAVVALVAPLLWPGLVHSPARSAARVVVWSAAGAAGAAAAVLLFGPWWGHRFGLAPQAAQPVLVSCAVLLGVLMLSHTLLALLEGRALRAGLSELLARTQASHTVALLLALLGSAPLWLGPVAEVLLPSHEGAVNALLAASPLTHLAVASGNDLLRNPWLYQHANLAALPVEYPSLAGVTFFYATACALLALAALVFFKLHPGARTPLMKEIAP